MSFSLHSVDRELRRRAQVFVVGIELQLELQGFAEVLDRRDVAEGLGEALVEEPFEALALDRDQIRQLQRLGKVGERITLAGGGTRGQGSLLVDGRTARGAQSQTLKEKAGQATHGNGRSYRGGAHNVNRLGIPPRAGVSCLAGYARFAGASSISSPH